MLNFVKAITTRISVLNALFFASCVCYSFDTHYFKQRVDHFNYGNQDFFLQRYLIAKKYWNENGGPIFFYTGNEGDVAWFANNTGFMWELAPSFRALLVFAEHRYYGLSLPYGNLSFSSPEYRGYLTTEQALADFASLIYNLKEIFPEAKYSSVITFGGSYGGMLAAWMRMKYPHLVNGALASSAPVLQFNGLTPCNSFSQIVTQDFAAADSNCVTSIKLSWKVIRNYTSQEHGREFLSKLFHLCRKLSSKDIDLFINWIAETWQNLAMTDYPYVTNFLRPLPAYPVLEACKYLKNSSENFSILLYHVYEAISVFHNYTGDATCFNISESVGGYLGEEQWDYQSCTEMVMPMCSDGVTDMFEKSPWNFSLFSEMCESKWKVRPDISKAIIMYGGRNISAASNIFFSNGKLDPWSAGGILKNLSDSLIAYVISDAAHHLDLRASNKNDPLSVKKAREAEYYWIKKWVN